MYELQERYNGCTWYSTKNRSKSLSYLKAKAKEYDKEYTAHCIKYNMPKYDRHFRIVTSAGDTVWSITYKD